MLLWQNIWNMLRFMYISPSTYLWRLRNVAYTRTIVNAHTHLNQDSNICLCIPQEKDLMSLCSYQTTISHYFWHYSPLFDSLIHCHTSILFSVLELSFISLQTSFSTSKYIYFLKHNSYNLSSEELNSNPL